MKQPQQPAAASDWASFADSLLHASHALRLQVWGPFLHDFLALAFGELTVGGIGRLNCHDSLMEYGRLLRQPPVIWGVGNALNQPSGHFVKVCYLLPTTTALATGSTLVRHARSQFGPAPFDELERHESAELGQVIRTGTEGQAQVAHLVCREPSDPRSKSLIKCFEHLGRQPFVRHALPFWGRTAELDEWSEAIAAWAGGVGDGQGGVPRLLIRFLPDSRDLGFELEKRLIRCGLLVGREDGPGLEYPNDDIVAGYTPESSLARFVSTAGPLTPRIFANWVNSNPELSTRAWKFHERIMRGEV